MKKITIPFLVMALSLNFIPTSFATFIDVPSTHPNFEAINFTQRMNIVGGYPDGTYKADNSIDRYEFTKIIIGATYSQSDLEACTSSSFGDVPTEQWFTPYVCVAQKNGVVSGYPDGTFQGTNKIKLSEAAKIIVNAYKYTVAEDPIWYKPFILKLEELKALPISLNSFGHEVTRGEMAEFIERLDSKNTEKSSTTYANLEAGVMLKAEPKVDTVYQERASYDGIEALEELGMCENAEDIAFTYNKDLDAYYGTFTWTGKIKRFNESDGAHLRLAVEDDGSLAFSRHKDLALAWNNEGFIRYENNLLYYQVGSLDGVNLIIATDNIDDSARALILDNIDSGKNVTLKLTEPYFIGGGAGGNFAMTMSCSIHGLQSAVIANTEPVSSNHLFYTSSYYTSELYYCDTDSSWESLSPKYLQTYTSEADLLKDYPSKTLNKPC